MDTDSAYMALSGSLHSIVRPELRRTFYEEYGAWFPRPYCEEHKTLFVDTKLAEYGGGNPWTQLPCCAAVQHHDRRTPGLFKTEFEGVGMVALNSKTYCCWAADDTAKCSRKGLSKSTNRLTKEAYLDVLRTGRSLAGTNKGFVLKDNSMYTYAQVRTGLTYNYAKRRVLEDGVSTVNIDL